MSFLRNLRGPGVPSVDVKQAAEMQGDDVGALIIDVREPNEYTQLRARGAVLLPLGQLNNRVNDLPRDRELLLMCRTGGRSANATQFLAANGFAAGDRMYVQYWSRDTGHAPPNAVGLTRGLHFEICP